MKIPLLIAFTSVCLAFPALADTANSNAALPAEALNLKRTFETDSAKAIQPIRQRYIEALNQLLNQVERTGNLDAANAIKAEIELNIQAQQSAANPSSAFTNQLIGTTWRWNDGPEITFQPKVVVPKVRKKARAAWAFSWETVASNTIKYQFPNGNKGLIVFSNDFSVGSVAETSASGQAKNFKITRVDSTKSSGKDKSSDVDPSLFFGTKN